MFIAMLVPDVALGSTPEEIQFRRDYGFAADPES